MTCLGAIRFLPPTLTYRIHIPFPQLRVFSKKLVKNVYTVKKIAKYAVREKKKLSEIAKNKPYTGYIDVYTGLYRWTPYPPPHYPLANG